MPQVQTQKQTASKAKQEEDDIAKMLADLGWSIYWLCAIGYLNNRLIFYNTAKYSIRFGIMDADQLLTSNYYIIVCKAGNLALRIQENDPNKFDKSRIISVEPNVQDVGQLFMVQKIGSGMDQY